MSVAEFSRAVLLGSRPKATAAHLDRIDAVIAYRENLRSILERLDRLPPPVPITAVGRVPQAPGRTDGAAARMPQGPSPSPAAPASGSGAVRSASPAPAGAGSASARGVASPPRPGADPGLDRLRRQLEHQVALSGQAIEAFARDVL